MAVSCTSVDFTLAFAGLSRASAHPPFIPSGLKSCQDTQLNFQTLSCRSRRGKPFLYHFPAVRRASSGEPICHECSCHDFTVYSVPQRCHAVHGRIGNACRKCGAEWTCRFRDTRADRRTDGHAVRHCPADRGQGNDSITQRTCHQKTRAPSTALRTHTTIADRRGSTRPKDENLSKSETARKVNCN